MTIRRAAGAAALLAVAAVWGTAAHAGGDRGDDRHGYSKEAWRALQQVKVEDLAVCYARGTDALGSAVNAVISEFPEDPVNLHDPQFAKALRLYRRCFSRHFSFTLEFDGVPLLTVPDTSDGLEDTDPALQWANFVNDAFRGPQFRNTQHHMGSISSRIRGDRARMVSYLIATHAYVDLAMGVRVVGGTYTDRVVRERGRWVIRQRTLNITSNIEIPQPLAAAP